MTFLVPSPQIKLILLPDCISLNCDKHVQVFCLEAVFGRSSLFWYSSSFASRIHLRQDGQQDLGSGIRRLREKRDIEALEAIQETGHGQVGPSQS